MGTPLSVLIVEDSASDAGLMVRQLQKAGYDVVHQRVETAEQMRAALHVRAWDVVLSDFKVPGFGAAPALALLHESGLDLPFILVSGTIGEEAAVELMRAGVHDYVTKDHLVRLAPAVQREVGEASERLGHRTAQKALRASEARFKTMFDEAPLGIALVDSVTGHIDSVNSMFAKIAGRTMEEMADIDWMSITHPDDVKKDLDNMALLNAGKISGFQMEKRYLHRDGTPVWINMIIAPVDVDDKAHPHHLCMMEDITEKKRAEDEIKRYVAQLETAFMSTVAVATTLSEMRDPYTAGHERRVAEIAVAIGAELGWDARRREGLRVAGYLHDVGKITIPTEILSRPGKLSPIEYKLIQGHAQASYEVLKNVQFPWPVAEVALQHHERMDGSGYPQGLRGEAILLEARIMAVADVVEAMSSHRPYRPGLGIDNALAEIERGRGSAYDPMVANACLKLFREKGYAIPA